jgi:hypothetical protein
LYGKQKRSPITPAAVAIMAVHALVLWMLCGAIVMIGRQIWSMETTLIVHAIGAPVIAVLVSLIYFAYFNYTTPLQTAAIFMLSAIFLDAIIVASFVEKSFEMFASPIGTWIPFGLIFLATYLTGSLMARRTARRPAIQGR